MSNVRSVYVASSWRNARQPEVVAALREAGHAVYDFRNPSPGDSGFHWSEIDAAWKAWNAEQYRKSLKHPIAIRGFRRDWSGMINADACVLVLPSGRSSHLEAGYFVGAQRALHILLPDSVNIEPELMYAMATSVCTSMDELLEVLAR